jgi:hypothetical protein
MSLSDSAGGQLPILTGVNVRAVGGAPEQCAPVADVFVRAGARGERYNISVVPVDRRAASAQSPPHPDALLRSWRAKNKSISATSGWQPRCAIVGGDGSLVGSGCGVEIDRTDLVFRVNKAPTGQFAPDVGSRTDVHVLNNHWLDYLARRPLKAPTVAEVFRRYGPFDAEAATTFAMADRPEVCRAKLAAWKCASLGNQSLGPVAFSHQRWVGWCIPMHMQLQLYEEIKRKSKKPQSSVWPTAGMVAVRLATLLCKEVHIFGMADGAGPYSYYPRSTPKQMPWHNFSVEHTMFDAWERGGVDLPPHYDRAEDS